MFLDRAAYPLTATAARLAAGRGTPVVRYRHLDAGHVTRAVARSGRRPVVRPTAGAPAQPTGAPRRTAPGGHCRRRPAGGGRHPGRRDPGGTPPPGSRWLRWRGGLRVVWRRSGGCPADRVAGQRTRGPAGGATSGPARWMARLRDYGTRWHASPPTAADLAAAVDLDLRRERQRSDGAGGSPPSSSASAAVWHGWGWPSWACRSDRVALIGPVRTALVLRDRLATGGVRAMVVQPDCRRGSLLSFAVTAAHTPADVDLVLVLLGRMAPEVARSAVLPSSTRTATQSSGSPPGRHSPPGSLTAYVRRAREQRGSARTVLFSPRWRQRLRPDERRGGAAGAAPPHHRFLGFPVRPPGGRPRPDRRSGGTSGSDDWQLPAGSRCTGTTAPSTPDEVADVARARRLPVLYDPDGDAAATVRLSSPAPIRTCPGSCRHLSSFADDWHQQAALVDLLVRLPNVFADTSGVRYFDVLADAISRAGPGKVLFGSDGPYLHPGAELAKVHLLHLEPSAERLVLGGNLCRLVRDVRRRPSPFPRRSSAMTAPPTRPRTASSRRPGSSTPATAAHPTGGAPAARTPAFGEIKRHNVDGIRAGLRDLHRAAGRHPGEPAYLVTYRYTGRGSVSAYLLRPTRGPSTGRSPPSRRDGSATGWPTWATGGRCSPRGRGPR